MRVRKKENIEIFCKYCEHASPLSTDGVVVCSKHGVVHGDHHCLRFRYDPLKREPSRLNLAEDAFEFPSLEE